RHVDDVRVVRMHHDIADVARVGQPHVGPRLTSVGRAIDAVAVADVAADGRLAGADVDDVGVGGRKGDCADRRGGQVAVGDVRPVRAGVGRLPDAPTDAAEVEGALLGRVAGHGDD